MNIRAVFHLISYMTFVIGIAILGCTVVSLHYHDSHEVLMSLCTSDLETAVSSVATTLGGVGPGLSAVGATHNFSFISYGGQLVLIACMLLGRLEFYTVFVLLLPSFWKK